LNDGKTLPMRRGLLVAFSLPAIMQGLMHAPEFQVQGIYAKYTGLSLTALAAGLLLTRIFDALTYPLIGQWSDQAFRRSGSRKGLMAVGTGVATLGLWFLFRPPPGISIVYYTGWSMVTYIGWKLTEIPYGAWSLGITRDYTQRTRVQLWRTMAALCGALLFYTVPFATKALGFSDTTELNLHTLAFTAVLIVICMPLLNSFALLRVPNGAAQPPSVQAGSKPSWRELLHAVMSNGPLLRLLLAAVPAIMLNGVAAATVFLFLDVYLHLGKQLPVIQLVSLPLTLLGMPFWAWLCQKFERHRVWAVSLAITALCSGLMAFVPVGSAALVPVLVLYPIGLFAYICIAVAFPSMMGDVVDYERLRTGEDRSGIYSAINAFVSKTLTTVSGALGIALVGWFGFEATATDQTAWAGVGIRLAAAGLPALGFLASAPLLWWFPITRARQEEIRAGIQARESMASDLHTSSDNGTHQDVARA
jgi:Na+/melibiose symporter-like transporter